MIVYQLFVDGERKTKDPPTLEEAKAYAQDDISEKRACWIETDSVGMALLSRAWRYDYEVADWVETDPTSMTS